MIEQMRNRCISTRSLEETRTIYKKSELLEIFMGGDSEDVLINFLIRLYKDFNVYKNHQMKEEANLFPIVLNYYIIIFKE